MMNCNSGRRKVFADELVASVQELAKKHGLDDLIVRRESDPVMVAARGCLSDGKDSQTNEQVEVTLHISPNLAAIEQLSLEGAQIAEKVSDDILRAFDLSEIVATDWVAKSDPREEPKPCD